VKATFSQSQDQVWIEDNPIFIQNNIVAKQDDSL
jgi:hypothetical protein